MSRRKWSIVLLMIPVLGSIWYFVPMQQVKWIGGYELTVQIESARPVRSVRLIPIHNRGEAEQTMHAFKEVPAVLNEWKSTTVDPFDGRPIGILITMTGSDTQSGREISRSHFSALLVIGEFADGQRCMKLVDIPDSRVSRAIRVELP